MATLPSSAFFLTTFTRSLRRSSLSGGMTSGFDRRPRWASDPRSLFSIALRIAPTVLRSNAAMTSERESGDADARDLLERHGDRRPRRADDRAERASHGPCGSTRTHCASTPPPCSSSVRASFKSAIELAQTPSADPAVKRTALSRQAFRSTRPTRRAGCCPERPCRTR